MKNSFKTFSSSKKNISVMLIVWLALSVAAGFGLAVSVAVFIYLETLLAFCFLFMILLVSKTKWMLVFENDILVIVNMANSKQYLLDGLVRESFVFSQSKHQKSKNCGDLKIVGCPAVFNDVKNIKELMTYVYNNFKSASEV